MRVNITRIFLILLVLVTGCGKDTPAPAPVAPTVVTGTATEIANTSAKVGGQVTAAGNASVTARGIVYATTAAPTTDSGIAAAGTGTGTFTATLINLIPGTTYHARAFATNSVGTSYGSEISFSTLTSAATLTTAAATNITSNSATSGGEITNDGGAAVTARGVCWSTAANPTISDSKTSDGTGTGAFVSALTSLLPGTTYHVRAYATNSVGTSYGSEITFASLVTLPVLTTKTATNIFATTADSGGDISSDGGAAVTERGVCWSTATNPTIADSKTTNGGGTGSFNSSIANLTPSTTYYVRAYATNVAGTSYGQQVSFVSLAPSNLAGIVSYVTVVTGAAVPITACQPSISGTTTLNEVSPAHFALGDASFGQYGCAWSDTPAVGVEWVLASNNKITVSGGDQYGILWTYSIVSNNGTTLVLSWVSSYGDAGTSSLTRTGGWPLNLSF